MMGTRPEINRTEKETQGSAHWKTSTSLAAEKWLDWWGDEFVFPFQWKTIVFNGGLYSVWFNWLDLSYIDSFPDSIDCDHTWLPGFDLFFFSIRNIYSWTRTVYPYSMRRCIFCMFMHISEFRFNLVPTPSAYSKKKKNWIGRICSPKKSDNHKTMEKYCGHNNRYPLSWEGSHANRPTVVPMRSMAMPNNGTNKWICVSGLSAVLAVVVIHTEKNLLSRWILRSVFLFAMSIGHRFERREALWFLAHTQRIK